MVLVALVAGLRNSYQQEQVLRQMLLSEMNVSQVHEFVQLLEDVKGFVGETTDTTTSSSSNLEINNTTLLSPADEVNFQRRQSSVQANLIINCRFCGRSHVVRKCPASTSLVLLVENQIILHLSLNSLAGLCIPPLLHQ